MTIARTEVAGIQNHATYLRLKDAFAEGYIKKKEWIPVGDNTTRPIHMNVRPVDFDEPFKVGGSYMMYPSDPAGPAEEIVNCRCAWAPHRDF